MEVQGLNLLSDEGEEVVQSPTFAALVATIHETLTKKVDVREKNEISFSAKDDVWDMEWRARTGFPLTTYLEKWESLRRIEGSGTSGSSQSGSVRLSRRRGDEETRRQGRRQEQRRGDKDERTRTRTRKQCIDMTYQAMRQRG